MSARFTELRKEISRLEIALAAARTRLDYNASAEKSSCVKDYAVESARDDKTKHSLLLLADSALPLGSFAFSSGLESYLHHHAPKIPFKPFLAMSITSLASTALPYVHTAYQHPQMLENLDNDYDASTLCIVARRASIAQGRALLNVWERSMKLYPKSTQPPQIDLNSTVDISEGHGNVEAASRALHEFCQHMKPQSTYIGVNGHFPPLWGVVCCSQRLMLEDTAYVFLLNHAKAVISAAVRASVLGPYAAQGLLASDWLRTILSDSLIENKSRLVTDAGQSAPVLDLWIGRHELLYSRIFNS